jgi:hypothetical protein
VLLQFPAYERAGDEFRRVRTESFCDGRRQSFPKEHSRRTVAFEQAFEKLVMALDQARRHRDRFTA